MASRRSKASENNEVFGFACGGNLMRPKTSVLFYSDEGGDVKDVVENLCNKIYATYGNGAKFYYVTCADAESAYNTFKRERARDTEYRQGEEFEGTDIYKIDITRMKTYIKDAAGATQCKSAGPKYNPKSSTDDKKPKKTPAKAEAKEKPAKSSKAKKGSKLVEEDNSDDEVATKPEKPTKKATAKRPSTPRKKYDSDTDDEEADRKSAATKKPAAKRVVKATAPESDSDNESGSDSDNDNDNDNVFDDSDDD